ncbi:hypothetical protein MESS4_830061 [Mesorhizobium sp. STM 4661]|nr:hypothetical protein MESS4_830061 [Mesorhizobium sp. STM 4661]
MFGSQGKAAFRRVASKGVYAGGGSIAEGGMWRKAWRAGHGGEGQRSL